MLQPPATIDNANVIAFVVLDPKVHHDTGSLRLFAHGSLQTWFHGLVVAQYENGGGVYLFFCDNNWQCENDTDHASIEDAIETANMKFGVLREQWRFRHES